MNSASPSSEAPASVVPGVTISSRFRLERVLGRGSMGSVWRARHLALNIDVAVKFIDAAFRDQENHRSRFTREARAAAKINSPHVVNVIDFGSDEAGRLYLAMELLQGEDLGKWLERSGRLSPEVTARIVSHACRGLSRAHSLGVVHRDIKPDNLFLSGGEDDGFVVKILDFGVAKAEREAFLEVEGTTLGQLIGSPSYMSPEQARGALDLDARSDLFSLGVVAYHCLTGELPFNSGGLTELLLSICTDEPRSVRNIVPGLPSGLDAWFRTALAKDPARRFQSAKDMAAAFCRALGQHVSSISDQEVSSFRTIDRDRESFVTIADANRSERLGSISMSNRTGTAEVADVIEQVASIANVFAAMLVDPLGACLAHHSALGLDADTLSDTARRIRDLLDTFDALDDSAPQLLAIHFESAMVFVRWIESHAVIVFSTEQGNPMVVAVGLNAAISKLRSVAARCGGPVEAFRPVVDQQADEPPRKGPSPEDPVPEEVIRQFIELLSEPLGPLARLAVQRHTKKHGLPTYAAFEGFVLRLTRVLDDDPETRGEVVQAALQLVLPFAGSSAMQAKPAAPSPGPHVERPQPSATPHVARPQPIPGSESREPSLEPAPIALSRPIKTAPEQATSPPATAAPEPPKRKRTRVYRGRVYEVDE